MTRARVPRRPSAWRAGDRLHGLPDRAMIAPARIAAYEILPRGLRRQRRPADGDRRCARPALRDDRDRALAAEIATGVQRWRAALDHLIVAVLQARASTASIPEIVEILRLSAYQLLHLTRVPASAVVDDAVNLARRAGKRSAAGSSTRSCATISRRRDSLPLPRLRWAVRPTVGGELGIDVVHGAFVPAGCSMAPVSTIGVRWTPRVTPSAVRSARRVRVRGDGGDGVGLQDELVGTFELVALEARRSDGKITRPYGDHPIGSFMFDAAGRFSVQLTDPERTADQRGYVAMFGTYVVDDHRRTFTLTPHGAADLRLIGTEVVRHVVIDAELATFNTPTTQVDGLEIDVHLLAPGDVEVARSARRDEQGGRDAVERQPGRRPRGARSGPPQRRSRESKATAESAGDGDRDRLPVPRFTASTERAAPSDRLTTMASSWRSTWCSTARSCAAGAARRGGGAGRAARCRRRGPRDAGTPRRAPGRARRAVNVAGSAGSATSSVHSLGRTRAADPSRVGLQQLGRRRGRRRTGTAPARRTPRP